MQRTFSITWRFYLCLVVLAVALVGQASPSVADNPRLYVTNNSGSTVSVLDVPSGALLHTIDGFARPRSIVVAPDRSKVYVTNDNTPETITIIDTATNAISGAIIVSSGVYEPPAFLPNGAQAFVSLYNENKVAIIDTASGTTVGSIAVATPTGLAVNHAGTRLYVANNGGDSVAVIDVASRTVLASIPTGDGPSKFAITPNDAYVYVSNNQSGNTVSAIDAATNSVTSTIAVGTNPYSLAVHPNGNLLYVGNSQANHISVVDVATQQVVATIPASRPQTLTIDAAGTYLFATEYYDNKVARIGLGSGASSVEFSGFNGPLGQTLLSPVAQYTLAVSTAGGGYGSVTSNPAGISCTTGSVTGCTTQFASGVQVTLTATPAAGSHFTGWSGCSSDAAASITTTIDADKSCTATFRAPIVPQIGWWSTPSQPGRGYGIEAANRGGPYKVLLSVFAKKRDGDGGWFVGELDMKPDASGFSGPMFEIDDAQDLLEIDLPKRKRPLEGAIGNAVISMATSTAGTLSLPALGPATPAATVPLVRYEFVDGGLTNPRPANLPQAGWWTSPEDSRWATFFEVQATATGQPVLLGAFHRMQKKGKVNSFFGTTGLMSNSGAWLALSMPLQECKESIDLDITGRKSKACRTLSNHSTTLQFLGGGTTANFTRPEGKTSLLTRYGF